MDSNTLNGFEVFEDFMMPGSNVNNNRMPGNENEFEGASEELTDEDRQDLKRIRQNLEGLDFNFASRVKIA